MKLGIAGSLWAGAVLWSAPFGASFAAAAQAGPAAWMEHVVSVELRNLPKNYSCYDLWYKFRNVLQIIGARTDWMITTQGCVFTGSAPARSSEVQLQFYLLGALSPAQARWADVMAVPRTVTLQANADPHGLDKSDCILMAQIKDELLPALPVRILDSHLDCRASAQRQAGYRVTVQTLSPLPAGGH